MPTASELMAANMSNAITQVKTWGGILEYPASYNAKGNGVTDDTSAFTKLLSAVGSDNATILLHKTYQISQDITFPSNVTLWFLQGGQLKTASGKTITINGPIMAGVYEIFSGDGTISGSPKIREAYPQWFGAKGDGATNDTSAFNKTVSLVHAAGGGNVVVPPGNYVVKRRVVGSRSASILLKPGVSLIGLNATLILQENCTFIGGASTLAASTAITANVAYGDTTITVSDPSIFAVGDTIGIRVGNNAWDSVETKYFDMVKVVSKAGSVITIDRPIMTSMTVASTATANKIAYKMTDIIENITISGFTLINDTANGGNAEAGVYLTYARNITAENIKAKNPGAGALLCAYCYEITGKNIIVTESIRQSGQVSKGRVLNFWNSKNISIETVHGEALEGIFGFFESYCENIQIKNVRFVNSHTSRVNSTTPFMAVLQGSEVFFENVYVEGNGGMPMFDSGGTIGNNYTVRNLILKTKSNIKGSINIIRVEGILRLVDPSTGTARIFNLDKAVSRELVIDLTDGMFATYYMDKGLWVRHYLTFSSNVVSGDVDAIYIGRESLTTTDYKSYPYATVGTEAAIDKQYGSDYPAELLTTERTKIIVDTASSGVGTGKTLTVRILFCPES